MVFRSTDSCILVNYYRSIVIMIDVKECFTKQQEAALKRDIRAYVKDIIMEAANEEAEKLAYEWAKDNKTFLKELVAEKMLEETKKAVKKIQFFPNVEIY